MQWNPELNVEELAQEWYELAVGEADILMRAFEFYLQTYEHAGGIVGQLLNQFLNDIGYETISVNAVKTTATEEEILQSLDFSQGPWTGVR